MSRRYLEYGSSDQYSDQAILVYVAAELTERQVSEEF